MTPFLDDAVNRIVRILNPDGEEYKGIVAKLLDRLDPTQPKGTKLCNAIMRVWTTIAFEAVAIRDNGVVPEVYLRRRALDDTAYPGQWHAPGSLYRHGERDRDVANRLEREFGAPIKYFRFVNKLVVDEHRGTVHSSIFLVELASDPRIDDRHNWFPVNNLPDQMVNHHREPIIPMAIVAHHFSAR